MMTIEQYKTAILRLQAKALKAFPQSKKQLQIIEQINQLIKQLKYDHNVNYWE
jgi:hypothetical protein